MISEHVYWLAVSCLAGPAKGFYMQVQLVMTSFNNSHFITISRRMKSENLRKTWVMMILWKYLAEGRFCCQMCLHSQTSLCVNVSQQTILNHVKQVSAFRHQESQSRLAYSIVLSVAKCWINCYWNIYKQWHPNDWDYTGNMGVFVSLKPGN